MTELDELLKEIRMKLAEEPKFYYEEQLDVEPGKFYDIIADVELAGAIVQDDRIKVLARMSEYTIHEDVAEKGFEMVKKAIKERVTELVPRIKAEGFDLYLYDLMTTGDIQEPEY